MPERLRHEPWRGLEAPSQGGKWSPLALSTRHPLVLLPACHHEAECEALPLPSATAPFQLLTLIADPSNTDEWVNLAPLTSHVAGLTAVPESLKHRQTVEDASLLILDEQLQKRRFHMLHLVCHGRHTTTGDLILYFVAGSERRCQAVRAGVFLEWLKGRPRQLPHILYLTMCDSARLAPTVSEHNPLSAEQRGNVRSVSSPATFAERLVTEVGIPMVIGMEGKLPLDAGPKLIQAFLKELTKHGSPALALANARKAYQLGVGSNNGAGESWVPEALLPVLYARTDRYFPLVAALRKAEELQEAAALQPAAALREAAARASGPSVRGTGQRLRSMLEGRAIGETGALPANGPSTPPARWELPEHNLASLCDRNDQWRRLGEFHRENEDFLVVLPGCETEGHDFFTRRLSIEPELKKLNPAPETRPTVVYVARCSESKFTPANLLDLLKRTLLKELGPGALPLSARSDLRELLAHFLHKKFILVHESYQARPAHLAALNEYYSQVFHCLAELRNEHPPTESASAPNVICLQPLMWKSSPAWRVGVARLLLWLNIQTASLNEALQHWHLQQRFPSFNRDSSPRGSDLTGLIVHHLPTLQPIEREDVERLQVSAPVKKGLVPEKDLKLVIDLKFKGRPASNDILGALAELSTNPIAGVSTSSGANP